MFVCMYACTVGPDFTPIQQFTLHKWVMYKKKFSVEQVCTNRQCAVHKQASFFREDDLLALAGRWTLPHHPHHAVLKETPFFIFFIVYLLIYLFVLPLAPVGSFFGPG